jgi:H+/Cl- antiporter ClcA
MGPHSETYKRFFTATRLLLRRHWQKALRVREKVWLSQEGLHLVMAAVVGLMGGVVNVLFYLAVEKVQVLIVGHPGQNIVEVAESISKFWRFLTPALGGLAAGAVLFWGLRLAGKPRTTNFL